MVNNGAKINKYSEIKTIITLFEKKLIEANQNGYFLSAKLI
jgi:hypothetical protein